MAGDSWTGIEPRHDPSDWGTVRWPDMIRYVAQQTETMARTLEEIAAETRGTGLRLDQHLAQEQALASRLLDQLRERSEEHADRERMRRRLWIAAAALASQSTLSLAALLVAVIHR